jgi:hypothetical protein
MAISPWGLPRLDHDWLCIVPAFCVVADIAIASRARFHIRLLAKTVAAATPKCLKLRFREQGLPTD